MDIILSHTTADFDSLGAAVGLTRLLPGAKIVLTGGCHPSVRDFLALHRDEYALIERRSVNPEQIRTLVVVDTQRRDRLGGAAEWLDLPQLEEIVVYDHHLDIPSDIPATQTHIADVGAITTLIVEQLQERQVNLTSSEATVMALGIHVDTGSLTFSHATVRDALALAWLMQQGASLRAIALYVDPGFSPQLQELLSEALDKLQSEAVRGYKLSWVLLKTAGYVSGLSSLTSRLIELTESDALLLAASYPVGETGDERLSVIGRSQIPSTNLNELFQPLGGGGHSQAASLSLRGVDAAATIKQLVDSLRATIPHPPTARDLMSSPVRTIRPETTIESAQRILLRYGHSGLSVVNAEGELVGIISRRDIDIALHHGFSHAPVKGYMTTNVKTITPETTLPEIQSLMVTYDIGRLPVLEGLLIGIVTRTDLLRELHQEGVRGKRQSSRGDSVSVIPPSSFLKLLRDRLDAPFWELLTKASMQAEQRGWHLYLVGGAVRDLLLAKDNSSQPLKLQDIDLVVDGFHRSADVGAGVELARALQQIYPEARLEIHGAFQTAALLWHKDPTFASLWVDIATARTEFYPYPAANPEVEASSIRQDLYRRDFTINALAVRLTSPRAGELLDFFGGLLDLQARQIRVLHANSFIEDPTRIYRAVRFAVRLEFAIAAQTEQYIRYAIDSGVYDLTQTGDRKAPALQTRLKNELKYILQAPYWKAVLRLLADLGALQCIHSTLQLDRKLWRQLRLLECCFDRSRGSESAEGSESEENFTTRHSPLATRHSPLATCHSPLATHYSPLTTPWLLRLESILAHLQPEYRAKVAENLQLPDDSIKRLRHLDFDQTQVMASLPECHKPSQVVQLLRQYDLPTLILIVLDSPRSIRSQIWRYLTVWADIQPPLNGNDLKQLGYKPGPQYRQILEHLLAAKLDGVISDRPQAERFLAENYPQ